MGSLGPTELILIFFIALIIFGPKKLPELGKSLGRMMFEFRRASSDLKRTIEDEVEADRVRELKAGAPASTLEPSAPAPAPATTSPDTLSAPAPMAEAPDATHKP